jgi:hypothetical protein
VQQEAGLRQAGDTTTLNNAKVYADQIYGNAMGQLAIETTQRIQADLDTLSTAKTYTDTKTQAVQTNLNNEIQTRQEKDAEMLQAANNYTNTQRDLLQTNINNEATARQNADTILQTNINNEASTRQTQDANTLTSSKNYTDAQIAAALSGVQKWLPSVDTRADLPTIASSDIQTYLCRVIEETGYNGVYLWTHDSLAWTFYSDNADFVSNEELATALTPITASITAEATARQNADTQLQTNITNEANARISGDATLQGNIDTANASISELRTDLQDEITRAISVESDLQTQINSEGSEMSDMGEALNAEITNRVAADSNNLAIAKAYTDTKTATVQANLEAEAQIREGDDEALQTAIDGKLSNVSVDGETIEGDGTSMYPLKVMPAVKGINVKNIWITEDTGVVNLIFDTPPTSLEFHTLIGNTTIDGTYSSLTASTITFTPTTPDDTLNNPLGVVFYFDKQFQVLNPPNSGGEIENNYEEY